MKRRPRAVFVILVPFAIVAIVAVVTWDPGFPAPARAALEQYLRYQSSRSAQPITVQHATRAARPWNFTPQMSGGSFGGSAYFGTTLSYAGATSTASPHPTPERTPAGHDSSAPYGLRPLPFPPEDVWCVLLAQGGQTSPRVVFVLLHSDLYKGEWIVHQAGQGQSGQAISADLLSIGCELELP
jgi:hypothetical protein